MFKILFIFVLLILLSSVSADVLRATLCTNAWDIASKFFSTTENVLTRCFMMDVSSLDPNDVAEAISLFNTRIEYERFSLKYQATIYNKNIVVFNQIYDEDVKPSCVDIVTHYAKLLHNVDSELAANTREFFTII